MNSLRHLVLVLLCLLAAGCGRGVQGPRQVQAVTPAFPLDRVIQPAQGPSTSRELLVLKEYPETVYLTGASIAVLVDPGSRLTPKERAQLVAGAALSWVNPGRHAQLMDQKEAPDPNLFLLGQDLPEIHLPEGYGIPMRSNEPLQLTAQWMNRNPYLQPSNVRLQLTLFFTRGQALRPVRVRALYGWAQRQGQSGYYGLEAGRVQELGPPCLSSPAIAGAPEVRDLLGQVFQTRWLAPPGLTTNPVLVDSQLRPGEALVMASASSWPGLERMSLRRVSPPTDLVELAPGKMVYQPLAPLQLGEGHYQLSLQHRNGRPVAEVVGGTMVLYVESR